MDEDMQNSGFLECGIQDSFLLEGLECVYVSDAGHTQLFKALIPQHYYKIFFLST